MAEDVPQSMERLDDLLVISDDDASQIKRDRSPRFRLKVPAHWRSSVFINPYAQYAEKCVLEWFENLGCTTTELWRAQKFDAAGYVGIPFPGLSRDLAVRIGKYLSLWLLWDDVHVESLENRWRIEASNVFENHRPDGMTRFDQGWWELFQEFAARRSHRWVQDLCEAMIAWNNAAVREAAMMRAQRESGRLPTFVDQLEIRIATIGMYATVYLLEDEYNFELPRKFHRHPTVKQLKKISNEIVGLGNDIFSFGKDFTDGQLNLVSTLMHERGLSGADALAEVIHMHDRALSMYDYLAASIGSWGPKADPFIARWLQDVRYASLGFSLWEAQAPRYTAHKIIIGGLVVAPSFAFYIPLDDTPLGNLPN